MYIFIVSFTKEQLKWSYNRDFVWGTVLMWTSYVLAFLTAFNIIFEIYEAFRYNEWYGVITDIILWTSFPILVYVGAKSIRENASKEKRECTRISNLFDENCRVAAQSPFDKRAFMLEREMEQAIETAVEEDHEFIKAFYKNRITQAKAENICGLTVEERDILDCLYIVFDEITVNELYGYVHLKATVYPLFRPERIAVDGCIIVHLRQEENQISVILPLPVMGVYSTPVKVEGCGYFGSVKLDPDDATFDIKIEPFGLWTVLGVDK